jgi:hypothetical protein
MLMFDFNASFKLVNISLVFDLLNCLDAGRKIGTLF